MAYDQGLYMDVFILKGHGWRTTRVYTWKYIRWVGRKRRRKCRLFLLNKWIRLALDAN